MLKSGTSKIAKEQDILTNLLPNPENLSRSLPWRESDFPKRRQKSDWNLYGRCSSVNKPSERYDGLKANLVFSK